MEFCEKCGGLVIIENDRAICSKCGHKVKKRVKIEASEKVNSKETIAVVKEDEEVNPIVDMTCPKCKNKKAYFWTMQTRAGDESETKFYKCTECKHTWRKYR